MKKIEEVTNIDMIYVVTNNKFYGHFEKWKENYDGNVKIVNDLTNSNDDRLGAVGDIGFVVKNEKIDDDLMVIAGDNLFEYSLANFHDYFIEKNNSVNHPNAKASTSDKGNNNNTRPYKNQNWTRPSGGYNKGYNSIPI